MTREEALAVVISAADVRAQQWRQASKFDDGVEIDIDELFEADSEECELQAGMIEDAIEVL